MPYSTRSTTKRVANRLPSPSPSPIRHTMKDFFKLPQQSTILSKSPRPNPLWRDVQALENEVDSLQKELIVHEREVALQQDEHNSSMDELGRLLEAQRTKSEELEAEIDLEKHRRIEATQEIFWLKRQNDAVVAQLHAHDQQVMEMGEILEYKSREAYSYKCALVAACELSSVANVTSLERILFVTECRLRGVPVPPSRPLPAAAQIDSDNSNWDRYSTAPTSPQIEEHSTVTPVTNRSRPGRIKCETWSSSEDEPLSVARKRNKATPRSRRRLHFSTRYSEDEVLQSLDDPDDKTYHPSSHK